MQRGVPLEQALGLLINGFCKNVLNMLPLEYIIEANKLLSLKLEGALG